MIVRSNLENGGTFPIDNTGRGRDLSPEFFIEEVNKEAKSLVIMLDDMSIPFVCPYNHWVIFNIPVINHIPEGLPKGNVLEGAIQGIAYGRNKYRGPKPPFGRHMYVFSIYSIDTVLNLNEKANSSKVLKAMKNHILERTELIGYFK